MIIIERLKIIWKALTRRNLIVINYSMPEGKMKCKGIRSTKHNVTVDYLATMHWIKQVRKENKEFVK